MEEGLAKVPAQTKNLLLSEGAEAGAGPGLGDFWALWRSRSCFFFIAQHYLLALWGFVCVLELAQEHMVANGLGLRLLW